MKYVVLRYKNRYMTSLACHAKKHVKKSAYKLFPTATLETANHRLVLSVPVFAPCDKNLQPKLRRDKRLSVTAESLRGVNTLRGE
jgi:hypothetical protein